MNEFLRDRILRKLDTLSNERLYQVLDYVEFLESRYGERPAASPNVFQRFAEGVEDSLRAGRVSTQTLAETMNLMNKAMGVLQGVAAAGKTVASEVVGSTKTPTREERTPPPSGGAPPADTSSGGTTP